MRKISSCIAAVLLSVSGGTVAADKLSYNKIDVGVIAAGWDIDENDAEPSSGIGLSIDGSWEFASHVFGFAGVSGVAYESDESEEYDFTLGRLELGAGVNAPLASNLDLVAGASLQGYSEDYSESDEEYTAVGYGINLGLRGLIGRRVDWDAGLMYSRLKFDEYGFEGKFDIKGAKAGVRVHFTRNFAMGANVGFDVYEIKGFDIEADEFRFGLMFRFQFGDRDGSPQWER